MSRGNLIGITNIPSNTSVTGVWNLFEQYNAVSSNTWFVPITSVVTSGLVGYWDSGNSASYPGSGTTLTDLSSSALNMTVNASYINSNGLSSGVSASTPTTSILNTDTHSIFFMLRFDTNGSYPNHYNGVWSQIFSFAPSGTDRSPSIWRYENSRRLHWRYDPNNGGVEIAFDTARFDTSISGYSLLGGTEFPTNTWFYVGVTKNGATASAYVNGSSLGSGTITNPKTAGSSAITLWSGFVPPARLNALTIYNRAISASEVTQNFNVLRGRFGL